MLLHCVLSNRWATGQDVARILKQRLKEAIPEIECFLDVDDLHEGKGAEYVDVSQSVLGRAWVFGFV